MLKLRQGIEIYVNLLPIDMQKSIDGLSALILQEFKQDPLRGHLFIFLNGSRDKTKIIFWDRIGYTLHYKRLEKHKFIVPPNNHQNQMVITETQLNGLLAGLDFTLMGEFSEIEYGKIF